MKAQMARSGFESGNIFQGLELNSDSDSYLSMLFAGQMIWQLP